LQNITNFHTTIRYVSVTILNEKIYPYLLRCQWMLLPSRGDHQSNPKLMHIDGFNAFSLHVHEYNLYAHNKKLYGFVPRPFNRALASNHVYS